LSSPAVIDARAIQDLLTTSDGPAGICTLYLLAKLFPVFEDQEYVLERMRAPARC